MAEKQRKDDVKTDCSPDFLSTSIRSEAKSEEKRKLEETQDDHLLTEVNLHTSKTKFYSLCEKLPVSESKPSGPDLPVSQTNLDDDDVTNDGPNLSKGTHGVVSKSGEYETETLTMGRKEEKLGEFACSSSFYLNGLINIQTMH